VINTFSCGSIGAETVTSITATTPGIPIGTTASIDVTFEYTGSVTWTLNDVGETPGFDSIVIVPTASNRACPYFYSSAEKSSDLPGDASLRLLGQKAKTKKVTICSASCPSPASTTMKLLCGAEGLGVWVAGAGKVCPCQGAAQCDNIPDNDIPDCPVESSAQPTDFANGIVSQHGSAPCQAQICNFKLGGTAGCRTLFATTIPPCPP
jgi:hypothetical protein